MASQNGAASVASLPPEAVALAGRMYDAARSGQKEILEQALPAGLPANMTNEKGDTLVCYRPPSSGGIWADANDVLKLMLAAYHGHAELVKLLIQHGADPNRVNDRGQSPLAGAVFKQEPAVIDVLLEGGADPDHGAPTAMECITMFKQEEQYKEKFETASGRGKAASSTSA
ncbi:ankyrin-like protein [Seiridium cupressi]